MSVPLRGGGGAGVRVGGPSAAPSLPTPVDLVPFRTLVNTYVPLFPLTCSMAESPIITGVWDGKKTGNV
jgi:hypothetical protein